MNLNISDSILMKVEKPARYTGGEWNIIEKNPQEVDIRFAFCFPDVYEVGMSHLGMKILYHLLNEQKDIYCERVFAPWADMEEKMRETGIPLYGLESKDPLDMFDFIGFTLQYEMSYTNLLNMLDLSGIPIYASERKEDCPFVCAGGPCAYNPEPLADFIDFFIIGEGEEVILEVMDAYRSWKAGGGTRKEFLTRIAVIEGVYVPSFYDVSYNSDGTIMHFKPLSDEYPERIRKRLVKDLDKAYFPEKMIVPYTGIVHDRIMLELFRGCIHGCRFCQAGFIYRPVREKTRSRLLNLSNALISSTGYEEISLVSLSTGDYSDIESLASEMLDITEKRKINLSLPSLRIDSISGDLMEKASKVRKSGLTFAPEGGTQKLRDVINKGVTEEDLLKSVKKAFEAGWDSVKLYFMIGLPGETEEDIRGIAELAHSVVDVYFSLPKEKRSRGLSVNVSASSFVPKPFTPFQWEAQDSVEMLGEKQRFLKSLLKSNKIKFSWHDPELSFLEAVFARGDRRLGKVLYTAWEKGCRFDGWGECFKYGLWMQSFDELGITPHFYSARKRPFDELLPWDNINAGVSKSFLISENKKAWDAKTTADCRQFCAGCGISSFCDASLCNIRGSS